MSTSTPQILIPEGFKLYTENQASILLPKNEDTFLNPIQEFNRDLSVACIRTWSEEEDEKKRHKWENKKPKGKGKGKDIATSQDALTDVIGKESPPQAEHSDAMQAKIPLQPSEPQANTAIPYRSQKVVILEALSATGLRSIRYAKEIPLAKYVIANDLSPAATAAMRHNIQINGLGPDPVPTDIGDIGGEINPKSSKTRLGRVQVNEGDACSLMYSHRSEKDRVDVVDLDPYGSAAPFLDAAVQCIKDDGLLCVTCTDMSVLGNTNYAEKCFANYGGVPAKAEYCHEIALRLVLHALSTTAARYGRVFIRIRTAPIEVKRAISKTAVYYICSGCQTFYTQPLGRVVERPSKKSDNVNYVFKTSVGPPTEPRCAECGFTMQLAGPMWSGPIHDKAFASKVLVHVEENPSNYGTSSRMKGMLTLARDELETPFYFTTSRISSLFHTSSPSLENIANALLNANHSISRSHACPGSLKTTATRTEIHDIFRSWLKHHPIERTDKIKDGSPTKALMSKEPSVEANFEVHPDVQKISSKVKLVRYQVNPRPNWGPKAKPDNQSAKRKRDAEEDVDVDGPPPAQKEKSEGDDESVFNR